jgi:uncharacterized protein (DUF433 family)
MMRLFETCSLPVRGHILHADAPRVISGAQPCAIGRIGIVRESTSATYREHVVDYSQVIIRDPHICGGEPVIRGTRVTLRTVLSSLAEGDSLEVILRDFPTLSEDDLRAVIGFAAASAHDDLPTPGVPHWK